MSLLDLARDGVRTDTDFSAGIPATGRMSAESANFAFHRWDTGRVMATVRAALNQARSVTPTALGGGGTASYDAFLTLAAADDRFDAVYYTSQADLDDLMKISLPDGTVTTFIADSGTNFHVANVPGSVAGAVGDGRNYNTYLDGVDYKTIVWNPLTAANTAYTNKVRRFVDPRFGGKTFCYERPDGVYVSTDTIGTSETALGFALLDSEEGYSYDSVAATVYLDELGLFVPLEYPLDSTKNAIVWSQRGRAPVTPVAGTLPGSKLFPLIDRMITDEGYICEDHRLGSQVQVFEGTIIGAWNRVAIGLIGNSLYFSASLLPGTWEEVKVYGTIEVATMVGGRVWYKLTGSNTWYFTGVLP